MPERSSFNTLSERDDINPRATSRNTNTEQINMRNEVIKSYTREPIQKREDYEYYTPKTNSIRETNSYDRNEIKQPDNSIQRQTTPPTRYERPKQVERNNDAMQKPIENNRRNILSPSRPAHNSRPTYSAPQMQNSAPARNYSSPQQSTPHSGNTPSRPQRGNYVPR